MDQRKIGLYNSVEEARREAADLNETFLAYLLEMASIEALKILEKLELESEQRCRSRIEPDAIL